MNKQDLETTIEHYFPIHTEGMTIEERDFIITLLYNTKEIEENTDMEIEGCYFEKTNDKLYRVNGMISAIISPNRCFEAQIYIDKGIVTIDADIVKVCPDKREIIKEYKTRTKFTKQGENTYLRKTKYSYTTGYYTDEVTIDNFNILQDKFKAKYK